MIPEKMLEYLVLSDLIRKWYAKRKKRKMYDFEKIVNRMKELQREFLEPYVIDSTSKE